VGVKIDSALRREIDAYAEAHGITRSRAASHDLAIARETLRGREGIPAGKAEEILEALEGVRAGGELLGPPSFGLMRLLAHWATQSGGRKVSEDELLAELRSAGAAAECPLARPRRRGHWRAAARVTER
jgi:predicted transcriptional regulator